jgi:hypothetical protein
LKTSTTIIAGMVMIASGGTKIVMKTITVKKNNVAIVMLPNSHSGPYNPAHFDDLHHQNRTDKTSIAHAFYCPLGHATIAATNKIHTHKADMKISLRISGPNMFEIAATITSMGAIRRTITILFPFPISPARKIRLGDSNGPSPRKETEHVDRHYSVYEQLSEDFSDFLRQTFSKSH